MSKFNYKATFLADSLLGLLTTMLILSVFIPLLTQLTLNIKKQYDLLDMKYAIITAAHHYNKIELLKGIKIENNEIKLTQASICNYNSYKKIKICISVKN